MILLASLLSGAVVAATPATPLPWFTVEDYPLKAFRREWQGVTTFAVLVGPDGRPANCTVTRSSGYESLDKEACYIARNRARFTPAQGPDGQRAYGVYRSQVVWARPDRNPDLQRDPGPDLEVNLSQLPAGVTGPAAVKVAYFVDERGNASACTPLAESAAQPKVLLELGCQQVLSRLAHQPASAKNGPVATVNTAAVKFSAPK
jgi:TonB family protein